MKKSCHKSKLTFKQLIQVFMTHTASMERFLGLVDVTVNPYENGITEQISKNIEDMIERNRKLYTDIANKLKEILVDVFTSGEDVQKEYLIFTANFEEDKDLARQYLDIIFHELFIFSKPAIACDDENSVTVFLNTLEKDIESC